MDNDSAKRIGNVIYSVILGFTVNNVLFVNKDWANMPIDVNILSLILLVYFIVDWFSFNALATIDKNQESFEMFFTIIYVIFLGWLIVFANNLAVTNAGKFLFWASIYLISSSLLFILRLNTTMTEKNNIDLKKERYVIYDFFARLIAGITGFLYLSINKEEIICWPNPK